MERTVHQLVQGTPEWHAFRLQHHGASEAAAMLGLSKKVTRTQLLNAKKTGLPREFSDWVQEHILDAGHEAERLARPLAEEFAGVEFFPQTISLGKLSASSDGLDFMDEVAWENKRLNRENGPIVQAGSVPEEHMPQCQQVLMVTGASRLLFTVSDGTRENTFHTWVEPDTAWFDRIRAGWKQFEEDLANWKPEPAAEPAPVGRTPESLPALLIEVTGAVTNSNLDAYREHALAVFGSINRDLQTDVDFANAAKAVKWCGDVEDRLAAAKQHALSQTASIDALFRTIDDISAEARRTRLELDKLVKARSEARRAEIYQGGLKRLQDHIAALNTRLGKNYMPPLQGVDFAGVIRGKRSFDAMQDAVDTHLANAKIAANDIADKIDVNLKWLREHAAAHAFLFADAAQLVLKDNEAFAAIAQQRIDAHEAAEKARADRLAEEARERIRKEEEAKLRREQEERDRAEAQRKREEETAAARAQQERAAQQQPVPVVAEPVHQVAQPAPAPAPAPAPNVVAMPTRAPAVPTTPPSLKLGTIAERLGFALSADFLKTLGFEPAGKVGAHGVYHEAQFGRICAALVDHVQAVQSQLAA